MTADELPAQLKQKVLQDIQRSGFPLELRAARLFRDVGCLVQQSVRYTSNSSVHEIDLIATLKPELQPTDPRDVVGLDMIIECKTSRSRPWVFFHDQSDPSTTMGMATSLRYITDLLFKPPHSLLAGCMNTALRSHHYNDPLPSAKAYFEACGKDAGSAIYKAIEAVQHATAWFSSYLYAAGGPILAVDSASGPRSRLIQPVIILDGDLLLATPEHDGFAVERTEHVLIRHGDLFSMSLNVPGERAELVIDVVHISALARFVQTCTSDLASFVDHINSLRAADCVQPEFR